MNVPTGPSPTGSERKESSSDGSTHPIAARPSATLVSSTNDELAQVSSQDSFRNVSANSESALLPGVAPSSPPRLQELESVKSVLGKVLVTNLSRSLESYLRDLVPTSPHAATDYAPFNAVLEAGAEFLRRTQQTDRIPSFRSALTSHPIIQQADHSSLLLNGETFLNTWFFHKALTLQAEKPVACICLQCDAVKSVTSLSPLFGPGYVNNQGVTHRVFELSSRKIKYTSVGGLRNIRISLKPVSPVETSGHVQRLGIEALARFKQETFASASDAFIQMNLSLWDSFQINDKLPLILLDERISSFIVAQQLLSPGSFFHRIFSDRQALKTLIEQKDEAISSDQNIPLRSPRPDLFTYVRNSRLTPVHIDFSTSQPKMYDLITREPLSIELSPESLHAALLEERLYPDQFLAYVSRCLLPGITALGGAVQQDYLPLYRDILINTHARLEVLDTEELRVVRTGTHSKLGGAALIEPTREVAAFFNNIGPDHAFDTVFDHLRNLTIGECIGSLEHLAFWDGIIERYRERCTR